MDINSGIYTITAPSGKCYVGQSVNIKKRKENHFLALKKGIHENDALQRAYIKYGKEGLKFETIISCDKEHLNLYEQICIDGLNSVYNLNKIAALPPNRKGQIYPKISEETREKMRKAQIGRKWPERTQEHRDKLSKANKGKELEPLSEEQKKKISDALKGREKSLETRRKLSEAHRGRVPSKKTLDAAHSPESIAKRWITRRLNMEKKKLENQNV